MTIAVVAAMSEEIAPLARRLAGREPAALGEGLQCACEGADVWLMATGDGAPRARQAVASMLTTLSVDVLIGLGVAGGLTADLQPGDLVVLDRVVDEASGRTCSPPASRWLERGRGVDGVRCGSAVSAKAIAGDAQSKRRLSALANSTAVVDLESAAWCDVACDAGIAFVGARVVTDTHDEALPLDFERLRDASGAVDRGRVLRAAVRRPGTWRGLMRLRRRLSRAGETLADWCMETLAA